MSQSRAVMRFLKRFWRAVIALFWIPPTATITPWPSESQTFLLRIIAAAFVRLTGREVRVQSESKTFLLRVIARRLVDGRDVIPPL